MTANDYKTGRAALRQLVVDGVRDALKEPPEDDGLVDLPAVPTAPTVAVPIASARLEDISVRVDPNDRTSWLIVVKVPRGSLTDDEAMTLARLSDT